MSARASAMESATSTSIVGKRVGLPLSASVEGFLVGESISELNIHSHYTRQNYIIASQARVSPEIRSSDIVVHFGQISKALMFLSTLH